MSLSQAVRTPAPAVTHERRWAELHPAGRAIAAARCEQHRRQPGFRMPSPARWRAQLDFYGLRPLGGLEQARRLLGWARTRPGRADGRLLRRWVARVLLLQHRRYPGELTIAAGAQRIATTIAELGGPAPSRQAVQRVLTDMRADGVLFRVQRGVSALITGTRNHVSVYVVVAADAVDEADQRALDELRDRLSEHLPVRDSGKGTVGTTTARSTGEISIEQRKADPGTYAPRNAQQRAAAVDCLIRDHGWGPSEAMADEIRRIVYPALAGGFSARAVAAAFAVRPDGRRFDGPLPGIRQRDRSQPVRIRSLARVLTWRLRHWLTEAPRWADRRPAYPPPATAPAPRRGRPPVPAPRPPAIQPATHPADGLRAQMRAGIAAGNERRLAAEAAFREAKRAGRVATRR